MKSERLVRISHYMLSLSLVIFFIVSFILLATPYTSFYSQLLMVEMISIAIAFSGLLPLWIIVRKKEITIDFKKGLMYAFIVIILEIIIWYFQAFTSLRSF